MLKVQVCVAGALALLLSVPVVFAQGPPAFNNLQVQVLTAANPQKFCSAAGSCITVPIRMVVSVKDSLGNPITGLNSSQFDVVPVSNPTLPDQTSNWCLIQPFQDRASTELGLGVYGLEVSPFQSNPNSTINSGYCVWITGSYRFGLKVSGSGAKTGMGISILVVGDVPASGFIF